MSDGRPSWSKDVQVPHDLAELHGPTTGSVGLPARLFWSGPDPRSVRWDLSDRARLRDLYEIVLAQGTLEDVLDLVNAEHLVQLWTEMYLPRRIRSAWQPLIDSRQTAA